MGNLVAYMVAHDGMARGEDRFWVEDAPARALNAANEDRHRLDPP